MYLLLHLHIHTDAPNETEIDDEHATDEQSVQSEDNEETEATSTTKRPLNRPKQTPTSKRLKEEDTVLKKAISWLEKNENRSEQKKDSDDKFGEYIAAELRSINDETYKRFIKFRIQSLLYWAMTQPMNQESPEPQQAWQEPSAEP